MSDLRYRDINPKQETTNGSHTNTILITSRFPLKLYFPIPNKEEVYIDEYDYEKVDVFIRSFYKRANIVIDCRLEYILLVVHINYPDYCLVYDIHNDVTKTVYNYLSSRNALDIRSMFLYTPHGRKLIDLYLFIKHFCTNLNIVWKTDVAIDICKHDNNFITIVLNYINIHRFRQTESTAQQISEIENIVKSNFRKRKLIFKSIDELYTALSSMKMVDDIVKAY